MCKSSGCIACLSWDVYSMCGCEVGHMYLDVVDIYGSVCGSVCVGVSLNLPF